VGAFSAVHVRGNDVYFINGLYAMYLMHTCSFYSRQFPVKLVLGEIDPNIYIYMYVYIGM